MPEPSRAFLISIFIREYWAQLTATALLSALSTYAILFLPERLLDILIFIVLWLQLELSYRQWWFEKQRREPVLTLDGTEIKDSEVFFYIKNVGGRVTHEVNVAVVIVPREEYAKYKVILGCKNYLFKRVRGVLCMEFGRSIMVPPGKKEYVRADYFELEKCLKEEESGKLVFFFICRKPMAIDPNACSEALHIDLFSVPPAFHLIDLESVPPGVLTKLPNMLKDAYMYCRSYIYFSKLRKRLSSKIGQE